MKKLMLAISLLLGANAAIVTSAQADLIKPGLKIAGGALAAATSFAAGYYAFKFAKETAKSTQQHEKALPAFLTFLTGALSVTSGILSYVAFNSATNYALQQSIKTGIKKTVEAAL